MRSFITYCFADWMQPTFANGIMRIRNGRRTDEPIRHPLPAHWKKDVHYYIKPDPDFVNWTYSRCHRKLRRIVHPGDIIFFRTLWRSQQYFIGYFIIEGTCGEATNPVLAADPRRSLFVPAFASPISSSLILRLNPRAKLVHVERYHPNVLAMFLGREYLALNTKRTHFLKAHLDTLARNQEKARR